jgi:hypothetical protein
MLLEINQMERMKFLEKAKINISGIITTVNQLHGLPLHLVEFFQAQVKVKL